MWLYQTIPLIEQDQAGEKRIDCETEGGVILAEGTTIQRRAVTKTILPYLLVAAGKVGDQITSWKKADLCMNHGEMACMDRIYLLDQEQQPSFLIHQDRCLGRMWSQNTAKWIGLADSFRWRTSQGGPQGWKVPLFEPSQPSHFSALPLQDHDIWAPSIIRKRSDYSGIGLMDLQIFNSTHFVGGKILWVLNEMY